MHAYKFTYTTTNTDNRTVTVTETYYYFPTIRQVFANTRETFLKLASASNYTYLYFAVTMITRFTLNLNTEKRTKPLPYKTLKYERRIQVITTGG